MSDTDNSIIEFVKNRLLQMQELRASKYVDEDIDFWIQECLSIIGVKNTLANESENKTDKALILTSINNIELAACVDCKHLFMHDGFCTGNSINCGKFVQVDS